MNLGIEDPVLDIAKKLEKVALNDEYFKERGLYPNVDFYSGIIYRALRNSYRYVYGNVCSWKTSWLDCTMERDERKS